MAGPLFSVVLPVIRPPALLPFAIESVLAQTEQEFELYVICDGAPDETVACARQFAQNDSRVKVFPFTKGAGQGELYRDEMLGAATSRYVAHICDDDIWLPDHLVELAALLERVDFGNLPQIEVMPSSDLIARLHDLADASTRARMLTSRWNMFGPTVCGYRLSAYRKLEEGWSPAPPDVWSDLHMWRKFLVREDLSFGTRFAVTSLHFPTPSRRTLPLEERTLESRNWYERVRQIETRDAIVQEVHKIVWRKATSADELRQKADAAQKSANESWKKSDTAQKSANEWQQKSDTAQKAADEWRQKANTAQKAADELRQTTHIAQRKFADERRGLEKRLRQQEVLIAGLQSSYYWTIRKGIRQLRRRIRTALRR